MADDRMGAETGASEGINGGVLGPASGCSCSGFSSSLGYGASCKGWEYEGQPPWCYTSPSCHASAGSTASSEPSGHWSRTENGSFGHPYEQCVWRSASESQASVTGSATAAGRRLDARVDQPPGRRLQAPPRIAQLLASKPEEERYIVLISQHSHSFLYARRLTLTLTLTLTRISSCMLGG